MASRNLNVALVALVLATIAAPDIALAAQGIPKKYVPSAACDQGHSSEVVVLGDHQYQLTEDVLSPENVTPEIKKLYGSEYELATWDDLKSKLQDYSIRKEFLRKIGIPHQRFNYDCGNILIAPGSSFSKLDYTFIAHHNGTRPKDWRILDEIGGDDIHLGRWNHFGRALIKKTVQSDRNGTLSAEAVTDSQNASPDTDSVSRMVISTYQYYNLAKYCDNNGLGALNMNRIREKLKEVDARLPSIGLNSDVLWKKSLTLDPKSDAGAISQVVISLVPIGKMLPYDQRFQLENTCHTIETVINGSNEIIVKEIDRIANPSSVQAESMKYEEKDF